MYIGLHHQVVPGQRRTAWQQGPATLLAALAGLPLRFELGLGQAADQGVERGAAVQRLVGQQHQVAAGIECGHCGLAWLTISPSSTRAPAIDKSSLNTAPAKAELTTQDVAQPRGQKNRPAGQSTLG